MHNKTFLGGVLFLFLSYQVLTAKVCYVDQGNSNASDAGAGTSESAPWKTLGKAFSSVVPSDTVIVKGSTDSTSPSAIYNRSGSAGFEITRAGQAGKSITYMAYPGHYVIVEGDGSNYGIALDNASYHNFKGFIIRNFKKAAEGYATGIRDILIENCEFTKTNDTGLRLQNITNLTMRNCYVHHCFETGIWVRGGSNITFENVESAYNDDGQGGSGDGDGFAENPPADRIKFINCYSHHNSEDGYDLTGNCLLVNCVAEGGNCVGFKLWTRGTGAKTYYLINCIAKNTGEEGFEQGDTDVKTYIYNSFFYNSASSARSSSTYISNTIFYGYKSYVSGSLTDSHNLYYQAGHNGYTISPTSIANQDPLVVDAANGDFHLQTNSPAIDKGSIVSADSATIANLYGINIASDFEGVLRPHGSAYDIGPYEYNGSTSVFNENPTPSLLPPSFEIKTITTSSRGLDFAVSLEKAGTFGIGIYSIAGSKIWNYSSAEVSAGNYPVRWRFNNTSIPSGIFFIVAQQNNRQIAKKCIIAPDF